jgi:hypothetical protein
MRGRWPDSPAALATMSNTAKESGMTLIDDCSLKLCGEFIPAAALWAMTALMAVPPPKGLFSLALTGTIAKLALRKKNNLLSNY